MFTSSHLLGHLLYKRELQNYYFSYITIIVRNVKTLMFTCILFFYTGEQTVVLLPRSPSPSKRYFPIPLDSLEDQFRICSADDCKLFREEFNSLPCGYQHSSFEEASRVINRDKNRYPNILPYDHSRVLLTQIDGYSCTDYINASYIDGYKEKNKFIAAQGPMHDTVADFWRMVWEQKTATIVMLTNLKERKEDKCYQYWPDQGCWMYGNVRVAAEDFTVLVDYTMRKFCVQYQGSDGPRAPCLVTQLHFTNWPDFGVPFSPIGMLKFLKKVKTVNPSYAGPIVVHCSAGVGRTGTFIVIDAMVDMMHVEQRLDVFGFVTRIREQRSQLVQTDVSMTLSHPSLTTLSTFQMQYSFIYQALLEYYLYGDTELDVSSLEGHLQKLHNTRAPLERLGLEEEFRKLTNVRIMKENMRTGNLPANMKKNRVLQIIPCKEYPDTLNCSILHYNATTIKLLTEGLLHRYPRSSVPHGGGLLEDGVGVQVSLYCHAH
uniref:protein-tyrosine-phosphatase n=1 Tax=Oncorhynchus kisutch TaxID=8019 RepID=A0A8C7KGE4_ONCKI